MRNEILGANPTASLRAYVVWVPFLGANRESAHVSQGVIADPRVLQFWDGAALTSNWFAKNVDHSSFPAWDVYYLYGPNASWATIPEPLVSSGGSVIGESSRLKGAIEPLLGPAASASE